MPRAPRVRALVFDFDGLILDTETAVLGSWEFVYEKEGVELPMDRWFEAIGSDDAHYDPLAYLCALRPGLDVDALQARRRMRRDELLHGLDPFPGVVARLDEAKAHGLVLAVASSSPRAWVDPHLVRLGLRDRFSTLVCKDDVPRVKPDPALYRGAVSALGVAPEEAVAFEDTPHGVTAARRAGLACVAVPGPITATLDFAEASLRLDSLAELGLPEILAAVASPGAPV